MVTFDEIAEKYFLKHDLRDASISTYRSAIKAFEAQFGKCLIAEVDNEQILLWRKARLNAGLARRSWNTYASHLKTLYGYAMEQNLVTADDNIFAGTLVVPARKRKKTMENHLIHQARDWLTELIEQEQTSHKRAPITPAWFWLCVFETFYHTGIRLNALLHIRLEDVHLRRGYLLIRGEEEKTYREFTVPIMPGLFPHLKLLHSSAKSIGMRPGDQLFNVNRFSCHYRRTIMNSNQVESMFKKIYARLGGRITPHRFRHTLASDLMRNPERNLHLAKQLLNHSNIATTLEYIETDQRDICSALAERARHYQGRYK